MLGSMFPGHFRPSQEVLATMFKECTFVPDTNILLHLYRYTKETSDELFTVLEAVKDRLFVPYQVCLEFSRNRELIRHEQSDPAEAVTKILEDAVEKLSKIDKLKPPFR